MKNPTGKAEIINRLKNVRGHVAGIERMVEEEQACANILMQLSAVRASIEKIGIYMLEHNAVDCLCTDDETNIADKEKVEMIVKQIMGFLK